MRCCFLAEMSDCLAKISLSEFDKTSATFKVRLNPSRTTGMKLQRLKVGVTRELRRPSSKCYKSDEL